MQDFFFFFLDSREICESVICYCEALNDWPVIIKRSIRANCLQTRHSVHGLLNSFALSPPSLPFLLTLFVPRSFIAADFSQSTRNRIFEILYTCFAARGTYFSWAKFFDINRRRSSLTTDQNGN